MTHGYLHLFPFFLFSRNMCWLSYSLILRVYPCLCSLPGRWRCQQAGTCDPPACWDIRLQGQLHVRDTLLTQCSTFCCCASLPCSAARSDGGQETSGSPSQSWVGEKKEGIVVRFLIFFFLIQPSKSHTETEDLFWRRDRWGKWVHST